MNQVAKFIAIYFPMLRHRKDQRLPFKIIFKITFKLLLLVKNLNNFMKRLFYLYTIHLCAIIIRKAI